MPRRSTSKPTQKPPAVSTQNRPQRLQRLLASAGFGSRRQCEELIELGRVEVDREIVTKLGTTVDPQSCKVRVDGVLLKPQKLTYYAVNKPVGVVTTNRDPHGRPRVIDLVPPSERVFPVGRLDRNSEGLILLTNDGDLAQQLSHPKFGVRKIYRVTVAGRVDNETMRKMRKGIYIAEGLVRVDGAKILKARPRATDLEIVLREGKNREIRRILARFGHKVQQLKRIAVGPLRLGDTPPGAYRVLTREEVQKLRREAENPARETKPAKKGTSGKSKASSADRTSPTKSRTTKRPGVKKSGVKKPGVKPPARHKEKARGEEFEFGESQTVGSVIGDDSDSAEATSDRSSKARGGRRKPTKRVGRKSSGGSGATKRGIGKKRPAKKASKKKRTTKRAPATGSRRGGGRTTSTNKSSPTKRPAKKRPAKKRKR